MARWRLPASLRLRWPLLLLLASIGLTGLAAMEAHRAVRSHRAMAERALGDYAGFVAWSFGQHMRITIDAAVREAIGAVNHGDQLHTDSRVPDASELRHYLPWDEECRCHRSRVGADPAVHFAFELGSDTLGVSRLPAAARRPEDDLPDRAFAPPAIPPYTDADRAALNDTLTRLIHSAPRPDRGFAVLVGEIAGRGRFVAYTLMPTAWGDTLVYGVEYAPHVLTALTDSILERRDLLPETFSRGRPNPELVVVTLADARGRPLYGQWFPDGKAYAEHILPDRLGALRIRAWIRPDRAGQFLIGGLPRSRLPFLGGLLALAAALSLVAVGQLRREGELSRMRADFVAAVSHELRTPLAQMRLHLEMLRLGRVRTDEQRAWSLGSIERETTRLASLVDNVLRFSRLGRADAGAGATQPVDVAAEVTAIVEEFAPLAAARRARISVECLARPTLRLHPDALRRVLANLLENAVRYGPPGQGIRVVVECARGSARLTVADQGAGVPAAERERVWRPFERGAASRHAGGTGIGLTIVREVVTAHGGRAWVEDAPGGGAAFVVELPGAVMPTPPAPAAEPASAEAGALG
jgi:signal transduction histidine kinase